VPLAEKTLNMQINLFESIKVFIEIIESGSFTRAAENLQIHRPAVTKALQQLEQHCGVRLLQRTTRQIHLTPDGEEFYRRCKPLLAQADDLMESFAPERPLRGQLRIDMPIAFAKLLVVPNLPAFYRQHPEIEIVLSSSDRRRDMLREGLDCVLRIGELADGDYIARNLGSVGMRTCASPAYLAEHGIPGSLDDLQRHQAINWLNNSNHQTMRWVFQTPAGPQEMALPGKLVLDNSETYIAAGLAGLGLLQGMDIFLKPYLDSGHLVEVLPEYPVPPRKLSLIYPHRHLPRKVSIFAEWLATLL
jgi:DNA-binding transcriptional LysR family regulator